MADASMQLIKPSLLEAITRSDLLSLKEVLSLKGTNIEARDNVGRTPLHLAIITGSVDVCKCLLEHGARIDAWTDQGEATVHLAAKRGDADILLVIMGAVNRASRDNTNPSKETVHVNCLTRKYKMSPLYIAVALGR